MVSILYVLSVIAYIASILFTVIFTGQIIKVPQDNSIIKFWAIITLVAFLLGTILSGLAVFS